MNAILVSVDYTDCLRLTLPYNRHHFHRVLIVTTPGDWKAVSEVAYANRAEVYPTDAFYRRGAKFNKWLALEEAFDWADYRKGWLCVMDADVLWPKSVHWNWSVDGRAFTVGQLSTPRRRMFPSVPREAPPESEWGRYPVHPNGGEFAGYSQVFHADDPALGPAPWHETDWTHAGGADSFFQAKWDLRNKVRPPFEVLHLGPAGTNWMGKGNEGEVRRMLLDRRRRPPHDRFGGEKLK